MFSYLISIGNENSNIEILDLEHYSRDIIIISPENFLNSTKRIIKGPSSFVVHYKKKIMLRTIYFIYIER